MFTWAVVHVITYIYFLRAPQKASSSVTRPQSLIIFLKQPLLPVSPKLEPTHAPVAQTNSPQYNYCNIIQSVSVISRKWYYRNNFFFFSVDFISCAKNICRWHHQSSHYRHPVRDTMHNYIMRILLLHSALTLTPSIVNDTYYQFSWIYSENHYHQPWPSLCESHILCLWLGFHG